MAFIIVNQNNKNVFDILNGRKDKTIETYFKRYPRFERNKVKFITMDFYKPYYSLMHRLFRNAFDKTRISFL